MKVVGVKTFLTFPRPLDTFIQAVPRLGRHCERETDIQRGEGEQCQKDSAAEAGPAQGSDQQHLITDGSGKKTNQC